jgi:hypothetical protein
MGEGWGEGAWLEEGGETTKGISRLTTNGSRFTDHASRITDRPSRLTNLWFTVLP